MSPVLEFSWRRREMIAHATVAEPVQTDRPLSERDFIHSASRRPTLRAFALSSGGTGGWAVGLGKAACLTGAITIMIIK